MISRNGYDSFGEIVASSGVSQNAVTYTGQRLDVESGLMALGNGERYYNPSYGRFIQQDSYAGMPDMPQSLNRFSYRLNNPNTYVDPSGNEGVVADQMRSKLQNGIANTGNDTLDWWINFGANFVAGAGYDAVNTSSGFTLGMIDRNLQKAMRGEQITVSDLTTTNWYGGNQDGWNPGNLMYNGAKGAIKTVYETGAAIAHMANPITHLNEGISAMTDPVGHSERKRQEFNQTISGAKQWFNDLTGFIGLMASDPSDAMSLLGDAANTVGPDKTAQITGSAMAEAYMIVEGGVGVAKGVKALKVMRAAKLERQAAQVAIKETVAPNLIDDIGKTQLSSIDGKLAAESSKITKESIIRALRQSDTTEGIAVAKLIKKGKVKIKIHDTLPANIANQLPPNAVVRGYYQPGTNTVNIIRPNAISPKAAAGTVAHETKHWLQYKAGIKGNSKLSEFEAFSWGAKVGRQYPRTNAEIYKHVNESSTYKKLPALGRR